MLMKTTEAQVQEFLRTVSARYDDGVARAAKKLLKQHKGSEFDPDEILDGALRDQRKAQLKRDREFAMGRCDSH